MSNTLTRADLAESVHKNIGFSQQECGDLVDMMFDMMADAITQGQELKIARLGTFSVREKNARVGRNPKTMVAATIDARRVVTFRPSPLLKQAINDRA